MANDFFVIGKILDVKFKDHSYYGNPRYIVVLDTKDHDVITCQTALNADFAYSINNGKYRGVDHEYFLHYTPKGKLILDYINEISK